MKGYLATLYGEFLKARRTPVFPGSFLAFSLAPVMGALFIIVLRSEELTNANAFLKTKADLSGFAPDWPSYLNLIAQATGVGGVILFGFVASWIFGREYTDRTIKELLALPVQRSAIVLAKFTVTILWSIALVFAITLLAFIAGSILGLDGWEPDQIAGGLWKIGTTTILTLLLAFPVGWIGSLGRGYLAPLGFVILTVVLAQIVGALGFGAYFPWAIPAIHAKVMGLETPLNWLSYLVVVLTSMAGLLATFYHWIMVDENG